MVAMPLCCIIMAIRINGPRELYQLLLSDTKASNSFLWSASTNVSRASNGANDRGRALKGTRARRADCSHWRS